MIFSFEEKLLKKLEDNIVIVTIAAAVLLNIAIRYSLSWFTNSDLSYPLTTWYEEIKSAGGFAGLGQEPTDCSYNIPYLTLIAIFTYLPGSSSFWYKFSSGICDYVQAFAVAQIVYTAVKTNKFNKAALAFIVAISSPIVLMNSAGWGQCDSVYTVFIVLALLYLKLFLLIVSCLSISGPIS